MAVSSSLYGQPGAEGAGEAEGQGAPQSGPVQGEVVDAEYEVKD
jgi:hypothetical protein